MAAPGQMSQAAMEKYGEPLEVAIPRLMRELKAPHRVAAVLESAPNSVRKWLVLRGWRFDAATNSWVEPVLEQPHA